MFDWFNELRSSIETGIKAGIEAGLVSIAESIKSEVEGWLKIPEPAGPFERIRLFITADQPIAQACVAVVQDSWRLDAYGERIVELFEIFEPDIQECILLCRAQVKTLKLQKPAELQLTWARSSGYFGYRTSIAETIDWHTCEVPFHFKREQHLSSIEIGVEFKDSGTLWMRNVELLQAPVTDAAR